MQPVRVGIVGCGMISSRYAAHMKQYEILDIAACADLDAELAKKLAAEIGPACKACGLEQMLADPAVELVVNLTSPAAHAKVALAAIEAGRHVYCEKPLGVDRAEGQAIMRAAEARGVRVGCAPDTFLGAGHQTARKLVDDGAIGRVVSATAFYQGGGPENYHPNPFFLFSRGGGPLLDMGPYYLSALTHILGPIDRVVGMTSQSRPQRTVGTKGSPHIGKPIPVTIQDHVAGVLHMKSGVIVNLILSWANSISPLPPIAIFGLDGAVEVPDPNGFDGPVKLHQRRHRGQPPQVVEPAFPTEFMRGVGIADMAHAIRGGRAHRASGMQALHVLDALDGLIESAQDGKVRAVTTPYERPAPVPARLPPGRLDD